MNSVGIFHSECWKDFYIQVACNKSEFPSHGVTQISSANLTFMRQHFMHLKQPTVEVEGLTKMSLQ